MRSPIATFIFVIVSVCIAPLIGCQKQSAETIGNRIDQGSFVADKKASDVPSGIEEDAAKIGAVVADATITAKIKGGLIGEPQLKAGQIDVSTANGLVTLSGAVMSTQDSIKAQEIAQSIDGVIVVDNRLVVSGCSNAHCADQSADCDTHSTLVYGCPSMSYVGKTAQTIAPSASDFE
ncbi:MAG: BON domain-containing protein [Pseudomonadota bacterium]